MKASLIISFYKKLDFLHLILLSLAKQSEQDFEVILAEDDNAEQTKSFLSEQKNNFSFDIVHCSQENKGFRKNKILNQAISVSRAPYLIFIDGDCVLHPNFIAAHLKYAQKNTALIGRRLMLSESLSKLALQNKTIGVFRFFNFVKYACKKLDCGVYLPFLQSNRQDGIWGCNWSVHKSMLWAINGFDEDYTRAAVGEDVDVEWRLRENGAQFKAVKFKAVQYHLYHKANYNKEDVDFNFELLKTKKEQANIVCTNGINKL